MDFLEVIKRNVENSVLVCLKDLDVHFPVVLTLEKCLGLRNEHVGPRDNCTIIFEGKSELNFIFLKLNNR